MSLNPTELSISLPEPFTIQMEFAVELPVEGQKQTLASFGKRKFKSKTGGKKGKTP